MTTSLRSITASASLKLIVQAADLLAKPCLRSITASASLKRGVPWCAPVIIAMSPKHHCFGLIEARNADVAAAATPHRLRSITASASLKHVSTLKPAIVGDLSPKHHCFGLIEAEGVPGRRPRHDRGLRSITASASLKQDDATDGTPCEIEVSEASLLRPH